MHYVGDRNVGRNISRRVKVIKVEDDGEVQRVTVAGLADEEFELSFRGQPFGLSGVPPVGSVGYLHVANGRMDQAYLSNLEHPDYRPKDRQPGETTVYGKEGQTQLMDSAGNIIVRSPNGLVHINPPD